MAGANHVAAFPDPKSRTPAILIVEDEVLIRMVLSDYLQECGFRIYEAGTAAEAIEMIDSNRTAIDLVFTDIRMPSEMDGFGLARWIRENRPGLPVILTSADANKSAAAKELCENEPFFAKPYDVALVVAHIRKLMDAKNRKDPDR
jgi:CheY-like chemotaxis protein